VLNTLRSKILLVSGITFAVLPGIILLVLVQFNRVQTAIQRQTEEQDHACISLHFIVNAVKTQQPPHGNEAAAGYGIAG